MKYRAFYIEDGQQCYRYFDTMEQAQEFYDSRLETTIQKYNAETNDYEDVIYPTYEV